MDRLKQILFSLLLLGSISGYLASQTSPELKNFLWDKDFKSLIENYAEDSVTLQEQGTLQRKIEARSYQELEGLRVQVFAGLDKNNAEFIVQQMTSLDLDSVYLQEDNGLYKVQIGNFSERLEAEKMLDKLRYAGVSNAWIVTTTIHTPKIAVQDTTGVPEPPAVSDAGERFLYSIQVFVTGNYDKAQAYQQQLSTSFQEDVWIKEQDSLWKILLGKYNDESFARNRLEQIRAQGYPDAWLTQVSN
jgi:hypothetical protein